MNKLKLIKNIIYETTIVDMLVQNPPPMKKQK